MRTLRSCTSARGAARGRLQPSGAQGNEHAGRRALVLAAWVRWQSSSGSAIERLAAVSLWILGCVF